MIRIQFWLPRTPFGFAASGLVGLVLFAVIALLAFDGRPVSDVYCASASCFNARNQEALLAFGVALVFGTWIGTKVELAYLRRKNASRRTVASLTPVSYYGPSTPDVRQILDRLPELAVALGSVRLSEEAFQSAMDAAYRTAFAQGEALALALFVERSQQSALAGVGVVRASGMDSSVSPTLTAVALIVARRWIPTPVFDTAWAPFASVIGSPSRPGPESWAGRGRLGWTPPVVKPDAQSPSLAHQLGSRWGQWKRGRRRDHR